MTPHSPAARPPGIGLFGALAAVAAVAGAAYLARRAARRREEEQAFGLLDSVLQASPVGLSLMDRNLVVRQINPALARMSGHAPAESIGRDAFHLAPDLRPLLEPTLRDVIRRGRVVAEMPVERADPDIPGLTRHYIASYFPLKAPHGGIIGVGAAVSDVTRLREAERLIRHSEERFRSLTVATSAIVWTTPDTGIFGDDQPSWSAFTGQEPGQYEGWGWLDAVHPDDRAPTCAAWEKAVTARAPYVIEHRIRRRDGEWRHMLARAVPVLRMDGSIREWVGAHMDITERKRAEAQLEEAKAAAEEANLAKSQFIANMSHELRTPLSAVIGYTEMLAEEMEDLGHPEVVEDLAKIETNARHLLDLINGVLDISKIEAGRMEVHAEDFDVAELVRGTAETVDALVTKKGNRLALDVPDGIGTMHSDMVKVRQCLFNLLSNAAKFTENGTVTLTATREAGADGADTIVLSVRDTGIGMTPEQAANLFQRFVQADSSTTRRFGGTGLGLAITKAFAEMMGGTIAVDTREGEGTAFTVRLPADLRRAGRAAPAEGEAAPQADGRGLVLVIDDEPSMRALLSRFLRREGYGVMTAPTGAAGLELARRHRPAAILLDVMMPTMDGWSVLSMLKADPDLAAVPVIMVTAGRGRGLALSLGAAEFLAKPVEWGRLKAALDRIPCPTPPCRALVVEDDADTRALLRTGLEREGWEVHEAENGRVGLDRLAEVGPSVILLDLGMPEMDGFSFVRELRRMPEWRETPVIVVTGRDLTARERDRLRGRVRSVIPKDDEDPEGLLDSLREALASVRGAGASDGETAPEASGAGGVDDQAAAG
ncbi:MAG TPA: response regulator [Azospirillaceae bacterium]|nr:response regulator [Azospirillaceae bacterium]